MGDRGLLHKQGTLLAVPCERDTPKAWPAGLGLPPVASPWAFFYRAGVELGLAGCLDPRCSLPAAPGD